MRLLQEAGDETGFVVYLPLYAGESATLEQRRMNLKGFASAVFRMNDLVESAVADLGRSGYRVRHGGNWRTFVALSALGAIAIGAREYYPYAYISAPGPYCAGLTRDGCELVWQQVEPTEGDVIDQCVAYCLWQ
jgi:hypothetical protein